MSMPTAFVQLVYDRTAHGDLMREAAEKNPEALGDRDAKIPPEAFPAAAAILSLHEVLETDITNVKINGSRMRKLEGTRLLVEVTPQIVGEDLGVREQVALVNEAVATLARHFFCKLGRPLPMPEEEREEPEEEES